MVVEEDVEAIGFECGQEIGGFDGLEHVRSFSKIKAGRLWGWNDVADIIYQAAIFCRVRALYESCPLLAWVVMPSGVPRLD